MLITLKEALKYFRQRHYKYKGKTLTDRTIRSMQENNLFYSCQKCSCGKAWVVDDVEVIEMANKVGRHREDQS